MNAPRLTALQRLAGADRAPPEYGVVSPAIALRLAISRAAQDTLRAPLAGGEVTESALTLATMPTALPVRGLWVLLQGPGRARGVLTLDASLLAAVLQARTTGRITGKTVAERNPTQTDAILVRRFLAAFLDGLAERLEGHAAHGWSAGFQPRDRIADVAALPHLLDDIAYRALGLSVDVGQGLRSGALGLIVPDAEARKPGKPTPAPPALRDPDWEVTLTEQVMACTATVEAVLWRLSVPLADLDRWQPGQLLVLPVEALDQVALTGEDGRRVATGRLGQIRGRRAIRLGTGAGGGALPALGGPGAEAIEETGSSAPIDPADGLADLPDLDGSPIDGLSQLSGLNGGADEDLPDLGSASTELSDLPDLDLAGGEELPDLSDLPELDLPDLDLPDLDGK